MITAEQMVQREVLCCMSSLVSTLTNGCGDHASCTRELCDLLEQASELAAPVLDYEEAATQAGWYLHYEFKTWVARSEDSAARDDREEYASAQEWCNAYDEEGYEWEVYEHWAVSQWLAEKLQAQGERVDTDFAGLYIWARTTTGQAIGMDGCIQRIYADMTKPEPVGASA